MAGKKKKNQEENTVLDHRQHVLTEISKEIENLDEDVIAVRETGTKYTLVTRDPNGFTFIEGDNVPDELSGAYTTYIAAHTALHNWLKK